MHIGQAGHTRPAPVLVPQNGSPIANGVDHIVQSAAPDVVQIAGGATGHGAPGSSIVAHDRPTVSHGEDVIVRRAPHAVQGIGGGAGHSCPQRPTVDGLQNDATVAHSIDSGGRTAPDVIQVRHRVARLVGPDTAIVTNDGRLIAHAAGYDIGLKTHGTQPYDHP